MQTDTKKNKFLLFGAAEDAVAAFINLAIFCDATKFLMLLKLRNFSHFARKIMKTYKQILNGEN